MQQVLTEQQFYAGHCDRCWGDAGMKLISHLTSLLNALRQHAVAPGLKSKFLTWHWRLPHHLPLSPSISFLQPKPSFSFLCSQACSCFRVFEYTPTWDSICPDVLPPLMPPQLAPSCSSVGLKCNLLSQTFPNHILLPPPPPPPSLWFSFSAPC